MSTTHRVVYDNSSQLSGIEDESVDLVVTSPPYPMVAMWDEMFGELNQEISNMMDSGKNDEAFELMHKELDRVWESLFRVLKNGGIACINIGDSTRTLDGVFKLYNSHSRILNFCISIGFESLPSIIWRKSTNSPNKFMGSGMYPVGSHVTLEHEYILVLRKGPRRSFDTPESKSNRNNSAFFWEERNKWFSDTWFDVHGKLQDIDTSKRNRSAAYPFELAYRLINMFSVKNDLVLDPFLGTGTTTKAAICSERNSIGFERDETLSELIEKEMSKCREFSNNYIDERLDRHLEFIETRIESGKEAKHKLSNHEGHCVSSQEVDIILNKISNIEVSKLEYEVFYEPLGR
jgi:DNA modification methylase